jgi:hypothetical protein
LESGKDMNQGNGLARPGGSENQSRRRMGTIQNRCKMRNDPADLLFLNSIIFGSEYSKIFPS